MICTFEKLSLSLIPAIYNTRKVLIFNSNSEKIHSFRYKILSHYYNGKELYFL